MLRCRDTGFSRRLGQLGMSGFQLLGFLVWPGVSFKAFLANLEIFLKPIHGLSHLKCVGSTVGWISSPGAEALNLRENSDRLSSRYRVKTLRMEPWEIVEAWASQGVICYADMFKTFFTPNLCPLPWKACFSWPPVTTYESRCPEFWQFENSVWLDSS